MRFPCEIFKFARPVAAGHISKTRFGWPKSQATIYSTLLLCNIRQQTDWEQAFGLTFDI